MLLLVAACVLIYLLWPRGSDGKAVSPLPAPAAPAAGPGYQAAVADLAAVRSRLVRTSTFTDEEKKAIDTLTLALVAGSDKE